MSSIKEESQTLRRSTKEKSFVLRFFEVGGKESEIIFWKCNEYGNNMDASVIDGFYWLLGMEPGCDSLLGAPDAVSAGVWSSDLLLCGGAGWIR